MEEVLINIDIKKAIHTTNGNEILDLKLSIPKFGFVTIFGKSGVGKTTLLKMIAGLTKPDSGYIKVNNEVWFDSQRKVNIKPQQRNIGFVFQDYALFPNMTVKEHLLYAQNYQEKDYVTKLLDTFHLRGLCDRKPAKLSGGQQQRLSVARALARKPQILLLDEPLSALDSETRQCLQDEILQAHKDFAATTLLVSHDESEVIKLSDYVYIIEGGIISKQGKPNEVFNNSYPCSDKISPKAELVSIDGNILTIIVEGKITTIELSNDEVNKLASKEILTYRENSNS